ncbi:MAG: helix-turn-helix transcriptional regulator, partial [Lachnospiraceae bacterium]|nr:helix-turn-helix transcriptional regulator [Lachnospiraceae bacterium]
GINLAELARKSGVEYSAIYASLGDKKKNRELRANELIGICSVLKINPMDFAD